jgi:hypothetical protein
MPWHDFGGASWAISSWTLFGRLPVLVALAMIVWCAVRRGWSWRAAVLVTAAFVSGLSAGTALFPSIVGALFGGVAAWLVARRQRLGLVDEDWKWSEAEPESATSRTATGRLWVGGGLGAGSTQYRKDESGDGCSGDYTIYDRKGVNGWLQAEWEQPVGDNFVTWFGVRGGGLGETIKQEQHKESQVELRSDRVRAGFGQGWFELEKPTLSFGLGVLVARESTVDEAGNDVESAAHARLGGRFRGGFSGFGIDVGYVDRASMLGFPGAHIGVSGAIYDTDGAPHPDDWVFRYFAGWQTFPGAQVDEPHLMPGLGIQANVSRRYVFGLDGIFGDEGAAGAAHFKMVVSP